MLIRTPFSRNLEHSQKHLEQLVYPIYFLDYETYPAAVPVFDGCYPYQQVPIQYSLHIQEEPGCIQVHKEYLHNDRSNPIPILAQSLRSHMGDTGSVVVWNASFEGKCHEDMAKQFPELSDFLLGVNDRFYDLEVPFRKQLYVRKEFLGKTSIKNILPVLVPDLSYKDLAIQDGGAACSAWKHMIFDNVSSSESQLIYDALLKYCELDTLAMVKILEFLRQVSTE